MPSAPDATSRDRWWVAVALLLVASFIAACAGGPRAPSETERPPVVATATPRPTQALPAANPGGAVVGAVQACREKDIDRLRTLVAGPVSPDDVEALFARGMDVRLLSQTSPQVEDGVATVTVRLEVLRQGGVEQVERVWQLERGADGAWRLTALPDCY